MIKDNMMLTESDKTTIDLLAQKWRVKPEIHPDDFIFHFVYSHPSFSTKDAAIGYYFNDGQNSAQQLSKLLLEVCNYDSQQKINILEFASGYGCVTRHLSNVLPFANVTACDIHLEAINFIREKLRAEAILSKSVPEQLDLDGKFDVVFALSFFSHMPKTTFTRWLRKLTSLVKPGGHVIFTTHGLESVSNLGNVQFDQEGFWFQPSSEQKDLKTAEYGLACTRPEFVFSQLFSEPQTRAVYFQEGYWWKHQDVYILRREERRAGASMKVRGRQLRNALARIVKRILPNRQ